MNIRYHVELSQFEREQLNALLSGGRHAARRLKRAQILLAANEGVSDAVIAATLNVSGSTIYRTKRRLVEANLEGALVRSLGPALPANYRPRRKRFWWRRPVPIRHRDGHAGRLSFWLTR